jgi:hypothetical protein
MYIPSGRQEKGRQFGLAAHISARPCFSPNGINYVRNRRFDKKPATGAYMGLRRQKHGYPDHNMASDITAKFSAPRSGPKRIFVTPYGNLRKTIKKNGLSNLIYGNAKLI